MYEYASDRKINWLSWQSSNPPNGPLVQFKKNGIQNHIVLIFVQKYSKTVLKLIF